MKMKSFAISVRGHFCVEFCCSFPRFHNSCLLSVVLRWSKVKLSVPTSQNVHIGVTPVSFVPCRFSCLVVNSLWSGTCSVFPAQLCEEKLTNANALSQSQTHTQVCIQNKSSSVSPEIPTSVFVISLQWVPSRTHFASIPRPNLRFCCCTSRNVTVV